MTPRFDYLKTSPKMFQKLFELGQVIHAGSVGPWLLDLVNIRASQINGCAFCLDMHVKEAKIRGESELRLYHVAIWRESPLFTEQERAALEWTEVLTTLPPHGVPDDLYRRVREHFSEGELSDLTYAVASINLWNRLNVAARTVPGTKDEMLGLTKAGLVA